MVKIKMMIGFTAALLILSGCSQMKQVRYGELEPANTVEVTLKSGTTVQGTLVEAEPHQLVIRQGDRTSRTVPKTDIAAIKRLPPVYDQFGKGISENEIRSVETNKNTLTYSIGGGLLSFGASFFAGSMLANSISESSGTILAATTVTGGGLGATLFYLAGRNKDRSEAIDAIREDRQMSVQVETAPDMPGQGTLQQILNEEKERQEKLREEREELLRKLEESRESDDQ